MNIRELNKQQREAVLSDHPRILCLAGAGSGKTKTLVSRVARLIEEGKDPKNMAILTFTRAAAGEMRERLINLVGDKAKDVYAGTFHSFAAYTIRDNAKVLGYTPGFSIYDGEDTLSIVGDIIENLQYKSDPKKVIAAMEKNTMYNVPLSGEIKDIVSEYRFRCKRQNAIDLNHLIPTLKKFLENEVARYIMHRMYEYIFVDEFQDTDPRQLEILNTINPENLFIVGDDFQSLYGFRGADVSIIMGLASDPDWQTIKLEENYRSTHEIVNAANALIKYNNQTDKILKAHRNGAEIQIIEKEMPQAELDWIAGKCMRLGYEEGHYNTAVLSRTNRQVSAIAQKFAEMDIPYQIQSRKQDVLKTGEAKKLFQLMQAAINPIDDEAVCRTINWPKMRLTKSEFLQVEMYHLEHDCSFIAALEAMDYAAEYREMLADITGDTASEFFLSAVEHSGIIMNNEELGIRNRNDKLNEVYEFMQEWEERTEPCAAKDWLEYYKMRDIDPIEEEEPEDAVQIMTIHGSKGLEFDNIIISGLNEKTLPASSANIEEERRIMYVAMTRAKNRLYITRSATRASWNGSLIDADPSRFLDEIKGH